MVADIRIDQITLPLVYEPDYPAIDARFPKGWRLDQRSDHRQFVRVTAHDAQGALVQWAILRYLLTDARSYDVMRGAPVTRRMLAQYLQGDAFPLYTAPVLRALDRLGIGRLNGRWTGQIDRPLEIIAASRTVMARAVDALTGELVPVEDRDQLVADLRLLALVEAGPAGGH